MERKEYIGQKDLIFVMIKPLGLREDVHDQILDKIESVASIEYSKRTIATKEKAYELYKSNGLNENGEPKPYFLPMVDYFDGKEVELLVVSGDLNEVDALVGFWNPNESKVGEIRHLMIENNLKYDVNSDYDNLIHSSADNKEARREMAIWFGEEELNQIYGH